MLKAVFKSITNETLKRKVLQYVEILYFIYLILVNCCTSSKKKIFTCFDHMTENLPTSIPAFKITLYIHFEKF